MDQLAVSMGRQGLLVGPLVRSGYLLPVLWGWGGSLGRFLIYVKPLAKLPVWAELLIVLWGSMGTQGGLWNHVWLSGFADCAPRHSSALVGFCVWVELLDFCRLSWLSGASSCAPWPRGAAGWTVWSGWQRAGFHGPLRPQVALYDQTRLQVLLRSCMGLTLGFVIWPAAGSDALCCWWGGWRLAVQAGPPAAFHRSDALLTGWILI